VIHARKHWSVPLAAVLILATSCGPSTSSATSAVLPLPSAPEPAVSPPLVATPAGAVFALSGAPEGVVIISGGLVAVAVRNPDGLVVFDLSAPGKRRLVQLDGAARHLELAGPDGPVLVPQETNDRLVEVVLPSDDIVRSVAVGRQPHDVAPASGGRIFVGDELANTVHLIEPDGTTSVLVGPLQPGGLAASPDGSVVVAVGVRGRQLMAFRADGQAIGTGPCGAGPTHVTAGAGGLFWVADTNGGAVLGFRIGAHGPRQVARIVIGNRPYGLAYDGVRNTLWVTLTGSNQLVGLHLRGTAVADRTTYQTVRQPNSVAVDTATGMLVVTGSEPAGSIELIG
jgi:DNA-binding beta-propeller fold protein YncE